MTILARTFRSCYLPVFACAAVALAFTSTFAADAAVLPKPVAVPEAEAKTEAEMKAYTEQIEHVADAIVEMVPIKGGEFLMGSPAKEAGRRDDEGPQHNVKLDPFWMGKYEITWDVYEIWMFDLDIKRREVNAEAETERDKAAEDFQISQPTSPYTDMTFGMGKKGYPAICMTDFAARTFCQWLSQKTGRYYRLPTEAEWEYACRAGTTTAYSFGDDPKQLGDFGWCFDNSDEKYHPIGKKKANPWGLFDMHGNVSEWCLDELKPDFYAQFKDKVADNPLCVPTKEYPRVVRGGSWDADPAECRSAIRIGSTPDWKKQDPQIPKSIWYHTDALHVGFRVVRPLRVPTAKELEEKLDKQTPLPDRKQGRV